MTARKFNDLGVTTSDLPAAEPVLTTARRVQAPEWSDEPTPRRPTLEEVASGRLRIPDGHNEEEVG